MSPNSSCSYSCYCCPTPVEHNIYYANYTFKEVQKKIKKETKKEKIARLAKEKMFSSWKTYNEKTFQIKTIVQFCKPRHKIFPQKH